MVQKLTVEGTDRSVVGVFKNSGTVEVNWWKRQKGNKSVKSMTVKTEKPEL